MKDQFKNPDLERKNEIFHSLTSKLDRCNDDINKEAVTEPDENNDSSAKSSRRDSVLEDDEGPKAVPSLQLRRTRIIKSINEMVQMFNENNKLVRETNKE